MANLWDISADATDEEVDEALDSRFADMIDAFLNDDRDEFDHIDWQGWKDC